MEKNNKVYRLFFYIYAFSRHFYPKRLALHFNVHISHSVLVFPGKRTYDLGVASTNALLFLEHCVMHEMLQTCLCDILSLENNGKAEQ